MQAGVGKITGIGEVRDKDGNLKGTFELNTEGTEEQFEQLKKASEAKPHDDSSRNSNP